MEVTRVVSDFCPSHLYLGRLSSIFVYKLVPNKVILELFFTSQAAVGAELERKDNVKNISADIMADTLAPQPTALLTQGK